MEREVNTVDVDKVCANLARNAQFHCDITASTWGKKDWRYLRYLADRIIALRTQQAAQANECSMRQLDARDNRNLRAYGLPEIR